MVYCAVDQIFNADVSTKFCRHAFGSFGCATYRCKDTRFPYYAFISRALHKGCI